MLMNQKPQNRKQKRKCFQSNLVICHFDIHFVTCLFVVIYSCYCCCLFVSCHCIVLITPLSLSLSLFFWYHRYYINLNLKFQKIVFCFEKKTPSITVKKRYFSDFDFIVEFLIFLILISFLFPFLMNLNMSLDQFYKMKNWLNDTIWNNNNNNHTTATTLEDIDWLIPWLTTTTN